MSDDVDCSGANKRVRLNIGGEVFQTSWATLRAVSGEIHTGQQSDISVLFMAIMSGDAIKLQYLTQLSGLRDFTMSEA